MATLYLMQHGEAEPEQADPQRPLTPSGRAAVERVATRARRAGVRLDLCIHSGKSRAAQSAELLAAVMAAQVEQRDGLAPNDPVGPTAAWLRDIAEPVALVGHLPFLGKLASLLVAGNEGADSVRFTMGGLVCLVPSETAGRFSLAWALPPDLA